VCGGDDEADDAYHHLVVPSSGKYNKCFIIFSILELV